MRYISPGFFHIEGRDFLFGGFFLKEDTAVILLGHGSPVAHANTTLIDIAGRVKDAGGYGIVQHAFLQFEHPNFEEAVNILLDKGVRRIIVHPYFLYMGAHVTKDLPGEIKDVKERCPELDIVLASNLGTHDKLVEVAVERIEDALRGDLRPAGESNKDGILYAFDTCSETDFPQHPIEKESFSIIGRELDESKFSSMELPVVKRVVHATADFEYADLIVFGNRPIEAAVYAILNGADIITDVRMVEAGINKNILKRFGGSIKCFISDKDVAESAKSKGRTMSSLAMRKASKYMEKGIVLIGNAPTALREVVDMVKCSRVEPALVVGVPVGFVDAEESKETLQGLKIPYITVRGRKGGSTVAVAIINALLILAGSVEHKH